MVHSQPPPPKRASLARLMLGLVLFGISFGYIEAAVVVYLRAVYDPLRHQLSPERKMGELFPLIKLSQLEQADRERGAPASRYEYALTSHVHRLKTELGREFATLILLTGAALLAARNFNEWIAAFVVAFGIWDIFYYVFLKLLIDWPASLLTWDILFLIPVPWVGPVLSPMLVAAAMVVLGTTVLWRERTGRHVRFSKLHWLIIVTGGLVIVISFAWEFRHIMAGGYPRQFNWWLYGLGLLAGIGACVHAILRKSPHPPPQSSGLINGTKVAEVRVRDYRG